MAEAIETTKQKTGAAQRGTPETQEGGAASVGAESETAKQGAVDPAGLAGAKPAAVAKPVAAVKPISHDASVVKGYLDEYTKIMSPAILNRKKIGDGVALLARATQLVCNSPHDDARDVMWTYHQINKDKLMRENMAMRGVRDLHGKQAQQVMTTYTLFRHKTIKSTMAIDSKRAIELSSRQVVVYLDGKR